MDSIESGHVPNGRMIVIIPEGLAGSPDLAKKVYWMALNNHCDVHYLALVNNEDERLAASRNIATLKALTSHPLIAVSSKLAHASDWLNALKKECRPGDRIVCHEEQFVRTGFLMTLPIRDVLANIFDVPVETLSGFYHPWQALSRKWLYGLMFWVGCLVILGVFSLLEFQIDQSIQGWTHSILLFVVLFLEFGAFWAWSRMPRS